MFHTRVPLAKYPETKENFLTIQLLCFAPTFSQRNVPINRKPGMDMWRPARRVSF